MVDVSTKGLTAWSVEYATSPDTLSLLKDDWLLLQAHTPQASIFSTFDYNALAWKHFRGPEDELLVLTIRHHGQLVCIAPFKVQKQLWHGVPTRVVQWVAQWEGNCPQLLTNADPLKCWQRLHRFFQSEFSAWDLLQLNEITSDLDVPMELPKGVATEVHWDSVGYYIALDGNFDNYFAGVDAKVKANWRTRGRKIAAMLPTPAVEKIAEPREISKAVSRFISLERKSWKADARVGIGKDQRHHDFYQELLSTFASKEMAVLYFLKSGDVDLAATLIFQFGDVVYERHIAHNPDFSNVSPGVYLRTLVLQDYFGKTWREFDLMGMHPSIGGQRHKSDWATGQRLSFTYYMYRKFGRLFPVVAKNYLMQLSGRSRQAHYSHSSAKAAAMQSLSAE